MAIPCRAPLIPPCVKIKLELNHYCFSITTTFIILVFFPYNNLLLALAYLGQESGIVKGLAS